ncbi:MAG: signal peptide peptidase SppA [Candidatus Nanoarchaeia archaeon]|nr:signal peptide peptidase SppA [Candidatus Nanoarchaeia archaeon]MDD5499825.1 signal peptide peptidase SppA [Candidatus Nanoarchaeia archaeon]
MNELIKVFYLFGLVFLLILLSSYVLSGIYGINEGNVALIMIHSEIGISSSFLGGGMSSDSIIESLKIAENNPNVEAVILSINSPGGSVVACKEVAEYILGMDKPVVAWIRDLGTSGAYLISSASNYIVSDELSLIGNIGSKISFLSFNGTLEKYGAKFNEVSSGSLKEMGSPYKDLSNEEYLILSGLVNDSFEYFINFISNNRNLSNESIILVSDGRIISGKQGFDIGLVDALGSRNEVIDYIESINITDVIVYEINVKSGLDFLSFFDFNSNLAFPTYD